MTYLLLPGRQIVNTRYQERYLNSIVGQDLAGLPTVTGSPPRGPITGLVFAVTSCNKSNSRYNPLPFEMRSILVYEFARQFQADYGIPFHLIGIPHYQPSPQFPALILKEIAEQTDGKLTLTPENTVVFTSTPLMIRAYESLRFSILPGEYDLLAQRNTEEVPNDIVQQIGEGRVSLDEIGLSQSTRRVFQDIPDAVERIVKLFHDPILTEQGDLTETRNYWTYARAMSEAIDLKYNEIKAFLLPGKIVDEGCADGALIERIVRDFPDSDIIGVDLSAEMLARAHEAQRAGAFGGAFVFFKQQNLMTPVSDAQARTVDTIVCNSTLHELWSYGAGDETVREYLRGKFKQLRPNGCLVIRDVVGPESGEQIVFLRCQFDDGLDSADDVAQLSTQARFRRFQHDFRGGGHSEAVLQNDGTFALPLREAMEFVAKMEYVDNWLSEMHEEFCFWSFRDWTREMQEAGFAVLPESHAYVNQWRVEHSFQSRVQLFDIDMAPLPFPVTNMILVGEKR